MRAARAAYVVKTSNMKFSSRRLADYLKPVHQKACRTCSTIAHKMRAARAAWLFFFVQPIISLIRGVVVAVAVVILNSLFYRPELLEASLAITRVNYHGNV